MQRHTVKLILKNNKKNSLNQLPIYIRITIERKTSYISTGYYIAQKLWDERTESVKELHPLAKEINTDITNKKKQVLEGFINASVKGRVISAHTLKNQASANDIFSFYDKLCVELRNKREGATLENWRKHLLKLEIYNGSRNLLFEDITPTYLIAFENWLREKGIKKRKEDSSNYIHAIMKSIRKLFNVARAREIITNYPFGDDKYEMPETTPGDKDFLTLDELDKWEKQIPKLPAELKEAALWFLFGCYTGLRIGDWHLFDFEKRVHDTYIALRAKKNGEWVTVPLYPRLRRILKLCKAQGLTNAEPELNRNFKEVAKEAKIKKHLSSHCGRKTFAVTICLGLGVSSETAAELMGITLNVFVKNYSKVTGEKIRKETAKAWAHL